MWESIDHIVNLFPASFLNVFYIIPLLLNPSFAYSHWGCWLLPCSKKERRDWNYYIITLLRSINVSSDDVRLPAFLIPFLMWVTSPVCTFVSSQIEWMIANSTLSWGLLWGLNRIICEICVNIVWNYNTVWNLGVQWMLAALIHH